MTIADLPTRDQPGRPRGRPRNRVLERYAARVHDYRYEITRPGKCPIIVRCWHIGSGITAEAEDERECDARDRARERVEEIKREAGL